MTNRRVGLVLLLLAWPALLHAQQPTTTVPTSPEVLALGTTTDTAVAPGAAGSVSGKLRQISDDADEISVSNEAIKTSIQAIEAALIFAPCSDGSLVDSVDINLAAGTGNTEIVALQSGVWIYVCGWKLTAGGAGLFRWIYGQGTACATNETKKATLRAYAAGDGESVPNGGGTQFKAFNALTPLASALCIDRDTNLALDGHVTISRVTATSPP
jgi:hypothetical protein